MAKDPYRYFRVEARELVEQLNRGVLGLEKRVEDEEAVPRLLRLAHTLKGAARIVRQGEIADHAHAIEDILAPWRDGVDAVPREPIDAMLKLLDDIGTRVAALTPVADAESPKSGKPAIEEALRTGRVDIVEMDALLIGISQTHAQVAALRRSQGAAERARDLAELLVQQMSPRHGRVERLAGGASKSMAEELRTILRDLDRGLAVGVDRMERDIRQVRDATERLRLIAAAAIFTALERTARDAARTLGKRVNFEGRGGDVRLDAEVLSLVQGALLQMVRNAVAHGIESEGERIALGKPVAGRVIVDIARQGRHIVFSCTDDGAGVDLDAVRRAVQRKGWLPAATQGLSGEALLQLLLRGGLSTASSVTEVAGRGIGLDVVRDAVERLGGDVAVQTAAGQGTTVRLIVPLPIASLEALLVEAAGAVASIPLDAVTRTLRLRAHEIARTAQGDAVVHDGKVIPFISLSRILRPATPSRRDRKFGSAVIVRGANSLAAIGVDRLLGTASLVLRPLPELAPATHVVAGASLDVEGNAQIVLDPEGLVSEAQSAGPPMRQPESSRVAVLVIDDSLTTRTLEQSILESAGYIVHAVASAEEALDQARRHRYGLFLVDVEMPGMDGFTFIERARADPALRDVPAILITSRSSPEDRQRGKEVGAQAYIVKSEFVQTEFLQRVQQLVQSP
jgi:two-component system, chemotaxis family, sensor kinase CheA